MIVAGVGEAGDAVAQQFERGEGRTDLDVFARIGCLVGIHVLEQELLGVGLIGQPARELERRMKMVVDKPWRDHASPRAGHRAGCPLAQHVGRFADRHKLARGHRERGIAQHAPIRVDADQPVDVGDEKITLPGSTHEMRRS